jgi:hypothetical protein
MHSSDEDIFRGFGIEIRLKEPDDFLKIRETLTRIGVSSHKEKKLFQSCHILHKRGRYAIMHFKELFALDGKPSDLTDNDKGRRNTIANLLCEWGLLELVDPDASNDPIVSIKDLKIIKNIEKEDWTLEAKYNIGHYGNKAPEPEVLKSNRWMN